MLEQRQLQALREPFPPEALRSDTSRGFELTSIKAAYVIERLNEVFGPCGIGWRYVHAPFEVLDTGNGRTELVSEVALQYRFAPTSECVGTGPVNWSANGWVTRTNDLSTAWSEPILACGGKAPGKGGAVLTDARKSAVTDGLTKAASMLGIGHRVFKGLVRVDGGNGRERAQANKRVRSNGGNGRAHKPDATAFWALYHEKGQDISMEAAKALVGDKDWAEAYAELSALIAAQ